MLREFFALDPEVKQQFVVPGAHGQTGYTGLLVETAASSDKPDWKEMLNWASPIPPGHPLKRKFPTAYPDQVLPESAVPGITKVLYAFHDAIADLQRRFLRVIAEGIGCHETFFDEMVTDGPTLTARDPLPTDGRDRATTATCGPAQHGDINLITALPRATAPGLQVKVDDELGRCRRARGPGDHQHRDHARAAHQRADPDRVAPRRRRARATRASATASCSSAIPRPWTILSPVPSCCTPEQPQRFGAISAADALDEVLYEINLVEDARRVERLMPWRRRRSAEQARSVSERVGSTTDDADPELGRDLDRDAPRRAAGCRPWRPDPNVSVGAHVQPSGGTICADLPVAVSVPSACTIQLPLRIGSVTTRRRDRARSRLGIGRHRPRPDDRRGRPGGAGRSRPASRR